MSVLRTVDDLRSDALWRAGEPQSSSSDFWDKSLAYMSRIQQQLVLGGSIAVGRDLATSAGIYAHLVNTPITDWWWARKRGVITTAVRQRFTGATLTNGDVYVTLGGTVTSGVDIKDWHVVPIGKPTVARVAASTNTTVDLDAPWPEDTATGATVDLAKMEYDLPQDFLRFSAPPYVHSFLGRQLPVGPSELRDSDYPTIAMVQGPPSRLFQIGSQRVLVNAYDSKSYRVEFEYVSMPSDLNAGEVPVLPQHHRQVLASGAAMLMCFDKGDPRAANFASEYRELVGRMAQEHRRAMTGGSNLFGMFRTRDSRSFVIRSVQSYGEVFLQ